MTNLTFEMDSGFFACLTTLNRCLIEMSHGAHQWMSVTVPGILLSSDGEPRRYVIIGYTNPDVTRLENHLCFLLPLVALGGSQGTTPELLVRFSPFSTLPLSEGLYWEDGDLLYDALEDFVRFWTPLKECLCRGEMDSANDCQVLSAEWGRTTVDEASFKEELTTHMMWLSQSKEKISHALRE